MEGKIESAEVEARHPSTRSRQCCHPTRLEPIWPIEMGASGACSKSDYKNWFGPTSWAAPLGIERSCMTSADGSTRPVA
eukprot:12246071-Heterocapsa_arctica.AAC.1